MFKVALNLQCLSFIENLLNVLISERNGVMSEFVWVRQSGRSEAACPCPSLLEASSLSLHEPLHESLER